jgi:uncharacterized membrane protein
LKILEINKFIKPQSRWRSKASWISLFSFIALFSKLVLKIELPYYYDIIVNAFLSLLTAFGVFNNPTDANNF